MPQRGFDIVGPSGRAPGVGTPSEFAEIEAMSRAELIEFILATLESGELALDHTFRSIENGLVGVTGRLPLSAQMGGRAMSDLSPQCAA
jgi:hypothetical protein